MSEENVEIVRESYDAWNRGDMKAVGDLYAPDATVYPREDFLDSRTRHGPEEILPFFAELREAADRDEFEVEDIVEQGDRVVASVTWSAVITGTEDEVEMRLGVAFVLGEGKIREVRIHQDFAEGLEAAGLSE